MSLLVVDHPFPIPLTSRFNYSLVRRILASNPSVGNDILMLWGRPSNNSVRQHIYTNVVRAKKDRALTAFKGAERLQDHNMLAVMGSVFAGTSKLQRVDGNGGPFLYLPGDAHADKSMLLVPSFGIFVNFDTVHIFYNYDDREEVLPVLARFLSHVPKWRSGLKYFYHIISELPHRELSGKKRPELVVQGTEASYIGLWRTSGSIVIYPLVFKPILPDQFTSRSVSFNARPTWEAVVKGLDELNDLVSEMISAG